MAPQSSLPRVEARWRSPDAGSSGVFRNSGQATLTATEYSSKGLWIRLIEQTCTYQPEGSVKLVMRPRVSAAGSCSCSPPANRSYFQQLARWLTQTPGIAAEGPLPCSGQFA